MKRANMHDVAVRASVSKTTVSHVINQTRPVLPETRQRVIDAITELGYHPNLLARSLTTNKTRTIGMVIANSSNHFFGETMQGVEELLLPENYGLIVCNTSDALENEAHYLDLLLSLRVDGILAAATSQRWVELSRADSQHTPIVLMDRCFEDLDRPFVGVDNRRGARLGVEHLIACGHDSVGLLAGFDRLSTMRDRVAGYEQAIHQAGLPRCDGWIVYSSLNIEDGRRGLHQLMAAPRRPRAIFINSNLLALGALLGLRDLGLRCPEDVAIAAFDDHPWAEVSNPSLTVVRQPTQALGRRAAEMLLALIRHEPVADSHIMMECELIVRDSSGAPRRGQAA